MFSRSCYRSVITAALAMMLMHCGSTTELDTDPVVNPNIKQPNVPVTPPPTGNPNSTNPNTVVTPTLPALPAAPWQIDFSPQPANDKKAIALTFDDGPDPEGNTDAILDYLKQEGIKAAFFINTNSGVIDVANNTSAHHTIKRIVNEGHLLGNHTSRHIDLQRLTDDEIRDAFAQVNTVVGTILGSQNVPLLLNRAPFGSPFYFPHLQDPNQIARVGKVLSPLGVHVGWSIDPRDWECSNAACIERNVFNAVDNEKLWGTVLLHSTEKKTRDALPGIVNGLRTRGFHFITVDDVLKAKFGRTSAQFPKQ